MNAIEAARELLPWWVVWGPALFTLPVVFLATLLLGEAAATLAVWSLRRARPADPVEQWRLGFPARWMVGRALLLVPAIWLFVVGLGLGPLCPIPRLLIAFLAALVAAVAVCLTTFRISKVVRGYRLPFARWRREWLFCWTWSLGGILLALFAVAMPERFGPLAWTLLGVAFVSYLAFVLGFGILLLRAVGTLRPAGERLRSLVAKVAGSGRCPVVYEADLVQANAYALPFLGRMVFTTALLDALTDEQVEAVCAHELAHLREPKLALLARLLLALSLFPIVLAFPALSTWGLPAAFLLLFPTLVVVVFANRLSRSLERRADASATDHAPAQVYASALLGLHRANLLPLVLWGEGATHPHLYDRLVDAGMQPEFPRPAPPPAVALPFGLALYMLLPLALLPAGYLGLPFIPLKESALLAVLAIQGGVEASVGNLGVVRAQEEKWEEAATFFRASAEIAPKSIHAPASLVLALSQLDRCDEAEAALREAERRYQRGGKSEPSERLLGQARKAVEICRARHGRDRGD